MPRRLTRRRFARIALASSVAAGSISAVVVPSATTIFARTARLELIGIRPSPIPSGASEAPEVTRTEHDLGSGALEPTGIPLSLALHTLELPTRQSRLQSTPALIASNELVSGCAILRDGTLIVAITPTPGSSTDRNSTRLVRLGTPATTVAITGLSPSEQLGDLVATPDDRLLGLVARRNGTGPARLVAVDGQSGRLNVLAAIHLQNYWRVNTLAASPRGQLYASAVTLAGETDLVQLGANGVLSPVAPLSVAGVAWNNGLQNLGFSSAGEMLAFAPSGTPP